jgi:Leucine-rich repeat (LRR) protein
MGRKPNGRPPSSEPTVASSTKARGSGPSSRMNHKRGDVRPDLGIRSFMMAVGAQDNVNFQPAPVVRPGAVFVRPSSYSPQDDTHLDMDEDTVGLPIVAHLAPDAVNMEDVLEERWAARIAQGMEERTRQEINQAREGSLVNDDDIVVVVDDTKDARACPCHKKQLRWTLAAMLLLLVVVGVAVFTVLRDKEDKEVNGTEALSPPSDQSDSPSFSPVPVDPLVEELRSWIAPTREDLLRFLDPASPQSQALAWLQNDTISRTPGRPAQTVLERYVLAVLYYSTSGPSWGFAYLSDEDVCTWNDGKPATNYSRSCGENWFCYVPYPEAVTSRGVYCVEGGESIGTLSLSYNKLRGPLPWELALLTNLEVLDVALNSLTGSIPTRIMNLTSLQALIVSENSLSGSVPAAISGLTKLEIFSAGYIGLKGTLPSTISPSLVQIDLSGNNLTGPIPDSWWTTMPGLVFVSLPQNKLTGSLPSTFVELSNLLHLYMNDNLLTGPLPATFPASVLHIDLTQNYFTGSIPSTWKDSMPDLLGLSLDTNSLTGTIPSSLLAAMTDLD